MKPNIKSVSRINGGNKMKPGTFYGILMLLFLSAAGAIVSFADDTDIYKPKVKHNVMILMDSSGSMAWPLYENTIDYAGFYDYVCVDRTNWTDSKDETDGAYGTSAPYYGSTTPPKKERTKIYLIYANTGYSNSLTGDAGDPSLSWYIDGSADMGTSLSSDGELVATVDAAGKSPGDAGYAGGRITTVDVVVGGETVKMITLDGLPLPNGKDIALHDWRDSPDGSRVDNGFAGLVQAPGYYFSGYFKNGISSAERNRTVTDPLSCYTSDPVIAKAATDPERCYFFATGNYINMQMVFNLQVYSSGSWKKAWSYCEYRPPEVTYQTVSSSLVSSNYAGNAPKNEISSYVIYNALSGRMRVHFSDIRLWYSNVNDCDRIELYDANGDLKYTYKNKSSADFWSDWVTGKKITVRYVTYDNVQTRRWKIDKYEYESIGAFGTYKFDLRINVAKEAIIDVIETTKGKINWGLMTFNSSGNAVGGTLRVSIDPSKNDDQQKQLVIDQLGIVTASGGTPLGETLQDVFNYFYNNPSIYRECNKNFVIALTDGFPSADTEWNRISTLNFQTNVALHDDPPHQYTLDPMQYVNPANDYYDDVAGYMYTHDWRNHNAVPPPIIVDSEEISEFRKNSAGNITVHNIGFSLDSPMLQHASDLGGGLYLTAYSKDQLVSAFHALGLLIGEYTSYTAPVVSVDEANRVQSGDKLYMALFKPNQDTYWAGNLKKYGLAYGIATGCGRNKEWFVVDRTGKEATTCDGEMIPESSSFWSTVNDGGEVEKGGAGRLIFNSISSTIIANPIIETNAGGIRNILTKTSSSTGLVRAATDTVTNADLGVATDMDRYKIINFLYGYTYDAHDGITGTLGAPVEKSPWPMGPIIHATPKIIDYSDTDGNLEHRYVAVGANDGMLHVFDDTKTPPDNNLVDNGPGNEIFAFVPTAALTKLREFDPLILPDPKRKVYTVDSSPMLLGYKDSSDNNIKLLVFGLRRGGRAYYALNVTDPNPGSWSFKWEISNSTSGMGELGYSMPMPQPLKIKRDATTYQNVLLIPGGYDVGEDRPIATANDDYYLTTTHNNTMGRGIFIVDAASGLPLNGTDFSEGSQFAWPATGTPTGVMAQMKYCFAADPTVISDSRGFFLAAYLSDLYGQVWKLSREALPPAGDGLFHLNLIFKMNPMTDQKSDYELRNAFRTWTSGASDPRGLITSMTFPIVSPRKSFFSPDVSYAGNCFTDVPVLYMGTGDREHPTYVGSSSPTDKTEKNGLFSFYDAHAYFKQMNPSGTYNDSSNFFTERDLLNVTCGGMEPDVELFSSAADNWQTKANMKTFLREDMKGWYLLFSQLSGCYAADNLVDVVHNGEKSISPVTLFAKVVYAPTFQPLVPSADPCAYNNIARVFAVDYCTGSAVYNFYKANDDPTPPAGETGVKLTRLDRYLAIGDHIPSGVSVVIRYGKAAAFISVGGKIYPLPEIKMPGGMIPLYWREIYQ
jgi:type IV pilus assembly protein PilY1